MGSGWRAVAHTRGRSDPRGPQVDRLPLATNPRAKTFAAIELITGSLTLVITANPAVALPAIAPVRALLNKVKLPRAQVFLLSGRRETQRADTEACLRKPGSIGWSTFALRSAAQESLSATQFKSARPAQWRRDGWRLGLNIGDQVGDLAGGHTAAGFPYPNPIYSVP